MTMLEESDRKEVRADIAAGNWTILWGDVLDESDVVTLAVAIPTGTVGAWVAQQIAVQLEKFSQSVGDISDEIIHEATEYLSGLLLGNKSGEADINGVGVKAGIATYHRKMKMWYVTVPLPNNYQPYIGLRVTRPLPSKGSDAPIETAPEPTPEPAPEPTPAPPAPPTVPAEPSPSNPKKRRWYWPWKKV